MWIAKAAECKEKQSIIRVNKRELTAADLPKRKKADKAGEKDTLILSAEGLKKQKDEQEKTEEKRQSQLLEEFLRKQREQYQEQLESSKEASKGFDDLAKILEIARRIANGDKVPATDEKKLMEFSTDLYQAAKSMAMMNADKKHKKYKSLFEDEESKREKLRELEQEGSEMSSGETLSMEAEASAAEAAEIV